jgi:hypothetical protein
MRSSRGGRIEDDRRSHGRQPRLEDSGAFSGQEGVPVTASVTIPGKSIAFIVVDAAGDAESRLLGARMCAAGWPTFKVLNVQAASWGAIQSGVADFDRGQHSA